MLSERALWLGGLALAAAGTAAAVGYAVGVQQTAAGTGVSITATAGNQSVNVPTGQTLTINLPSGATWSAVGNQNRGNRGTQNTQNNQYGTPTYSGTGTVSGGTGTDALVISNVQSGGAISFSWITSQSTNGSTNGQTQNQYGGSGQTQTETLTVTVS